MKMKKITKGEDRQLLNDCKDYYIRDSDVNMRSRTAYQFDVCSYILVENDTSGYYAGGGDCLPDAINWILQV